MDANKAIMLVAEVFFVDGIAFLLTVVQRIKFVTAEHLPMRTALSLSKHMKQVLEVYGQAGFRVRTILMDDEYEKLKNAIRQWQKNMAVRQSTQSRR